MAFMLNYPYGNNYILVTLLQLCKVVTTTRLYMAICARYSQPCRVVTTLHDSCEVVVEIVKLPSTSNN